MAKYWKYQLLQNRINEGTEENPVWKEYLLPKMIPATEANEEIAKAEAYNGEYEPFDDGIEEVYQPTESERLEALEQALLELMGVSVDG